MSQRRYVRGRTVRTDGSAGVNHIVPVGEKKAICGTKARVWQTYGYPEVDIEFLYKAQLRNVRPRHRPRLSSTPCLRCIQAAQKLRDPLDRLADINTETNDAGHQRGRLHQPRQNVPAERIH